MGQDGGSLAVILRLYVRVWWWWGWWGDGGDGGDGGEGVKGTLGKAT